MSFSARQTNINEVLSRNTVYYIPFNQRKYVWGEKEWNDLFEDLFLVQQKKKYNHFLGSVVFAEEKKNSNMYSIIDGQQRLVTLSILFSALMFNLQAIGESSIAKSNINTFLKVNKDGDDYYKIERKDGDFFMIDMIEGVSSEEELSFFSKEFNKLYGKRDKYNQKLLDCFLYMVRRVSGIVQDNKSKKKILLNFKERMINCEVIEIVVESDVDGYRVFETLNARGIPLEQHELIKNYLYSYIRTQAGKKKLNAHWKRIQENVTVDETDHFANFISNFCVHKYGRIKGESDFTTIKTKTDKTKVEELLENLYDDSVFYSYILRPDEYTSDAPDSDKVVVALDFFKKMGIRQVRPLLLSLFESEKKNTISHKEFVKCILLLEHFYFLYIYVLQYKTNLTDEAVFKLAKTIHEGAEKPRELIIEELGLYITEKDKLKQQFVTIGYSRKNPKYKNSSNRHLVNYMLYKIEKYYDTNDEGTPKIASIEHIAPDDEFINENSYIGNLLPLSTRMNGNVGDKPLKEKVIAYRKSNLFMVKKFIDNYGTKEEWNRDDILERGKRLSEIAIDYVWKFGL